MEKTHFSSVSVQVRYNKGLINQLFVPYGKKLGYHFFIQTSFHSVHTKKFAVPTFCHMDLAIG